MKFIKVDQTGSLIDVVDWWRLKEKKKSSKGKKNLIKNKNNNNRN